MMLPGESDRRALLRLIEESQIRRKEWDEFDRSAEEQARERYTYARRQVFLEILRQLLADPALKIGWLAAELGVDPPSLAQWLGQDVTDWVRERLWRENA